jgi:homocitrate synthase
MIAETCKIGIPFNNYITGSSAFIHKAGIHAKAVLADPTTYEILRPQDFGLTREVAIGHRLTGWNAIRERSRTLGLRLDDDKIKAVTQDVKRRADVKPLELAEIDLLLREAAGD